MKKKLEDQYKSTPLADAHRAIFTTKVHVQPSTSDEDVEFEMLNFKSEISQLRSRVHTKVNSAHESTVGATANSDLITKNRN